ncbi:sensor histidine kinase [Methylobacterium trifolii]|uniref:histidine kinase n=1 Tax=Methylobacterium trifolii TaxID=1003092 RepID=A0ABQ4U5D6_9HYPH|nr:sensor histidine kinase [Methylobacterium trifolii]GJE62253.1 Sensor histidine kinase RcsC [Methylobacterium trifolii]
MTKAMEPTEAIPANTAFAQDHAPRTHLRLATKLALALVGLVTIVLLINGAVSVWLNYREARRAAFQVQQEKARGAAERVDTFISEIESQIGWTARAEWRRVPLEQQRYDFIRLLRQAPAITEVAYLDPAGKEQLRVSRLEPDVVGSGKDYATDTRFVSAIADKVWFGPVYLRRGSEPYMTVAVSHSGRDPGVTVAEVNLKLIWDVVSVIRVGTKGYAFVVTSTGRLVAHPDLSFVLRDSDLSRRPEVAQALAHIGSEKQSPSSSSQIATVTNEDTVLSAHAVIRRVGWIVFVQLPLSEAIAPVYVSLIQTLVLLILGILLATVAGTLLARRLVVPIQRLQEGAERFGVGDLSQRISIKTGDEIEILADRFNLMAGRVQEAYETLEAKVEERTRDLNRSLDDLHMAQDRLVQSEKLASLGHLVAGVAHEINTPLGIALTTATTICGETGAFRARLSAGPLSRSRLQHFVDRVDEGADLLYANLTRAADLVHGFKQVAVDRSSDEHRSFVLDVWLNELVASLQPLLRNGGHVIRQECPFGLTVETHPGALGQVVTNLISNAVIHAFEARCNGHIIIRVSHPSAEYVRIEVADDGRGITPTDLQRVFDPFFTTARSSGSTGLGMHIVHNLVTVKLNGRIDVNSTVGRGTIVSVEIPIRC